jgi:hypothetical protein
MSNSTREWALVLEPVPRALDRELAIAAAERTQRGEPVGVLAAAPLGVDPLEVRLGLGIALLIEQHRGEPVTRACAEAGSIDTALSSSASARSCLPSCTAASASATFLAASRRCERSAPPRIAIMTPTTMTTATAPPIQSSMLAPHQPERSSITGTRATEELGVVFSRAARRHFGMDVSAEVC